jgi:hypothetical protein
MMAPVAFAADEARGFQYELDAPLSSFARPA